MFIQQIQVLNILNMVYTLLFSLSLSSKCSLFRNSNVFDSCIIDILYTGCAKIKRKINSGDKRLTVFFSTLTMKLKYFSMQCYPIYFWKIPILHPFVLMRATGR